MKNIYTILLIIFCGNLTAQDILFEGDTIPINVNTSYRQDMNYLMSQLNFNDVTSGLLLDYGVAFNDLAVHSGTTNDSVTFNLDYWRSLYASLYTSRVSTNAQNMASLPTINQQIKNSNNSGIDLLVMDFNYHTFNPNAISNGLMQYTNGKLYDVSGNQSPYLQKDMLAFTPTQMYFTDDNVLFNLQQSFFYTNNTKSIQSIQLNADNGNGFQTIYFNVPLSLQYASNGVKNIQLKITYQDNSVKYANSIIYINATSNSNARYPDEADLVFSLESDIPYNNADGNIKATGTVQISYGDDGVLTNPLIVIEGLDVWKILYDENDSDNATFNFDYKDLVSSTYRPERLRTDLQNLLEAADYDIVFLDFDNGADFIQRNAYLVEKLIAWVNANKLGTNENVVLGISMGGLVAHYALRDMEIKNQDHETRLYASFDSPHQGANLPLGFQGAVWDLATYGIEVGIGPIQFEVVNLGDISDGLGDAINVLRSPAAVQMVKYQVKRAVVSGVTTPIPYTNPYYTSFMNEYETMGYPQNCRNIAISNGSECGKTDLNQYEKLMDADCHYDVPYWQSFLYSLASNTPFVGTAINALPFFSGNLWDIKGVLWASRIPFGGHDFNMDFDVWTLPNQQSKKIYNGEVCITKNLFWFIPITNCLINTEMYSSVTHLPYDNAPGGVASLNDYGDIPDELIAGCPTNFADLISFIPTTSSLDVNSGSITSTDIYRFYSPNDNTVNTPFDNFKTASKQNESHVQWTASNSDWFWKEISGNPEVIACRSFCLELIEGDDVICANSTENYEMPDLPNGMNFYWSLNGEATITSPNFNSDIDIVANNNSPSNHNLTVSLNMTSTCGDGTANKEVWVGKADLTSNALIGDHFTYPNQIESYYLPLTSLNAAKASVGYYSWNTPSGWTKTVIKNGGLGQNYRIGTSLGNYFVTGTAYNKCGAATASKLVIVKSYNSGGNCRTTMQISPNPTTSKSSSIQIMLIPPPPPCDPNARKSVSQNKVGKLTVVNNYGKPVYQQEINKDALKIPAHIFKSGIYMVTYQLNDEIIEGKFVIE